MITDVAKGFFRALGRSGAPRIDYLAFYRATVQAQSSDLSTVDVQPDDARLPGMTGLGIRPGLPGTKVKIPNGVSVMIGFMGGSPSLPYVETWESGSGVTEVQVGGTTKVFRDGDPSKASTLMATWMGQVEGAITGLGGVTPSPTASTFATTPGIAVANGGSNILKTG